MIDQTVVTPEIKIWLFDYENTEWERVRSLCLEEDNWLRENYLPNRCKISDHKIFFIAYYHDGRPMMFGGIKEYTPDVARAFNRMYAFPYVRSVKKFNYHHKIMIKDILPAMEKALDKRYGLLFVSMQMRKRFYPGEQKWWQFWKQSWFTWADDWKECDRLIKTCSADVASCYQNIVYRESEDFKFSDWNPESISYQDHLSRFSN